MKTVLKDRTLWYDGASVYDSKDIAKHLKNYRVRWVDALTPDVVAYNKLKSPRDHIRVKESLDPIESKWIDDVQDIDDDLILEYVGDKHARLTTSMDESEITAREHRLAKELSIFKKHLDLWEVLRCMVYVVNELTRSKQVWGIGRGSSVSSYLLYVVGVHDVDSFLYDLDIRDFIAS